MEVGVRAGVLRSFASLPDPRMKRTRKHELVDLIAIAICAIICGADGWVQVALFARSKRKWFETFLHLPHGIASHDTFGRVFARLDPAAFERCFIAWMNALAKKPFGRLIAIDGKTLRASFDKAAEQSPLHLVSAWCEQNQTVLGQWATAAKSNEITAIPELLDLLDLEGAVVTTDALGCQTAIAEKIVSRNADYVLQVKGNQPKLEAALIELFGEIIGGDPHAAPSQMFEDLEKGHGRIETRRCWMTTRVHSLPETDQWAALSSAACVESVRLVDGQEQRERRYFISSIAALDAERMLGYIRGHWGVENGLHWCLDVGFDEDHRRIRTGLSRIGLNLLKQERTEKVGIKSKRLRCGWDHDYLLKVLIQGD
ncbi:MAG: ISAs1 family transposase [Planctomycetes bacterium]|nr:ISAs1 family transposase [Planctomycetota bacterium]